MTEKYFSQTFSNLTHLMRFGSEYQSTGSEIGNYIVDITQDRFFNRFLDKEVRKGVFDKLKELAYGYYELTSFAANLFSLDPRLVFHNFQHSVEVPTNGLIVLESEKSNLLDPDINTEGWSYDFLQRHMFLAGLLHDIGMIYGSKHHENLSIKFMYDFFDKFGSIETYSGINPKLIAQLIMGTKIINFDNGIQAANLDFKVLHEHDPDFYGTEMGTIVLMLRQILACADLMHMGDYRRFITRDVFFICEQVDTGIVDREDMYDSTLNARTLKIARNNRYKLLAGEIAQGEQTRRDANLKLFSDSQVASPTKLLAKLIEHNMAVN